MSHHEIVAALLYPPTVKCVRCGHRYRTVRADGICDVCVFVDDLPEIKTAAEEAA